MLKIEYENFIFYQKNLLGKGIWNGIIRYYFKTVG